MHTDESAPDPTAALVVADAAPVEEPVIEPKTELEPVYCRHCGEEATRAVGAYEDWQCSECERYQDSMVCPTCKQVARASLMPAELVAEPHAPRRRRKSKES